jgi:hypothetical protein
VVEPSDSLSALRDIGNDRQACPWSFYIVNARSLLVIPTEPSASGRRGINAERFVWTAEKKESLRGDPWAAVQDDRQDACPTARKTGSMLVSP